MAWKERVHKIKYGVSEQEVVKLYQGGLTVKEVAENVGRSPTTVRYILEKHGIKRRNPHIKHPSMKEKIDEKDIIYLAGLFDGEGSVFISKRKNGHSFDVRLAIYNTSEELMTWLRETFGGTVVVSIKQGKSIGIGNYKVRKNVLAWQKYRHVEVKKLLELMLPYLKVKREKAIEAVRKIADNLIRLGINPT
jgi:hypothetical protein